MSDLAVLIDYDNWATERMADFCAKLTPQQRALTTPGTMGTVGATLIHLVAAKERYASALGGRPVPEDGVRETTTTDPAQVVARAKKLSDWFRDFGKRELDLEKIIERRGADGSTMLVPLGILLAQFLHHGNEHRAQLGSIFGANGIEPPHYSAFNWGQEQGKIS
ncbi:MAG TPA: DinB family protein [Candidatus Limnocylindria bacterium]|nr:DinB family protein [Candidatus Limnocylindria bacterium]